MKYKKILLLVILILAACLRFYRLGEIPAGIHADEESHGYNAFSLLETGKDRYGQSLPILFRSFGSYQPPLYTYLSILPVKVFGNTIFAARFVSATAGVALVLITYLFALQIFNYKYKDRLALISAFVIAISPWSIFFNRLTAEGSLGVTVFTLSVLFFTYSLKKPIYFPIATLILGLSTHAYYSERIISILFLPIFILLFRNYLFKNTKRWVFIGLAIFLVTLIPHLLIVSSGALTKRLVQVGLTNGWFPIGEVIKKYITYFSPANIFFDTGENLGRISPDIGVFYSWFMIPFFVGIKFMNKYFATGYLKILIILMIVTPISAALTGDSFYPLRVLDLIWIFSLIIAIGFFSIYEVFPKKVTLVLLTVACIISIVSFYISYFVLFKYERAKDYGYSYVSLMKYLKKYPQYRIIIDSTREYGAGLRIAYLTKYNPADLQKQLQSQLKTPYYSADVNLNEDYKMGNIETHFLSWQEANLKNVILVGDTLSISDKQAQEHRLKYAFDVKDMTDSIILRAYFTD